MDCWTSRATFGPGFAAAFEFSGAGGCYYTGPAVIGREALLRIGTGRFGMSRLRGYWADVAIAGGGFFFTRGARVDSAVAVVANVRVVSYYYSGVIGVVNDVHVDVIDCGVVEEMAAVPTAAFVAVAEIAEAVVNAAVETYRWSPESCGEGEAGAVPAPPGWRPEETDFWSFDPRAGDPEIIAGVVIVIPVAGGPDVAVAGADGLIVDR